MKGRYSLAVLGALILLAGWARPTAAGQTVGSPPAELVERAYERFRGLVGDWRATSTKGWGSRSEYRLLGRGSVVLAISSFDDAAPERDMASAVHRDGERLLLTHYCEAGNQPRLVATRISSDAREVEFHFLDGTGMRSRDEGHMDRVVFRFVDENRFTSRWTWFQGGRESWMEEIIYVRQPSIVPGDEDQSGTTKKHR